MALLISGKSVICAGAGADAYKQMLIGIPFLDSGTSKTLHGQSPAYFSAQVWGASASGHRTLIDHLMHVRENSTCTRRRQASGGQLKTIFLVRMLYSDSARNGLTKSGQSLVLVTRISTERHQLKIIPTYDTSMLQ